MSIKKIVLLLFEPLLSSITIITFYEIATRRMEIKMNNDTLDTSRWKKRNIYGRLNALCSNAFPAKIST